MEFFFLFSTEINLGKLIIKKIKFPHLFRKPWCHEGHLEGVTVGVQSVEWIRTDGAQHWKNASVELCTNCNQKEKSLEKGKVDFNKFNIWWQRQFVATLQFLDFKRTVAIHYHSKEPIQVPKQVLQSVPVDLTEVIIHFFPTPLFLKLFKKPDFHSFVTIAYIKFRWWNNLLCAWLDLWLIWFGQCLFI